MSALFYDADGIVTEEGRRWREEILPEAVDVEDDYLINDVRLGFDRENLYRGIATITQFLNTEDRPKIVDETFVSDKILKDIYHSVDFYSLICAHETDFYVSLSRNAALRRLCHPETWRLKRPMSHDWMRIFLPTSYPFVAKHSQNDIDDSWVRKGFYYHLQLGLTGISLCLTIKESKSSIYSRRYGKFPSSPSKKLSLRRLLKLAQDSPFLDLKEDYY